jgi:asparagine N-glycosylation enzyme membrane subunit Stt3
MRPLAEPVNARINFSGGNLLAPYAQLITGTRLRLLATAKETKTMLWTIFVILLILWLLGFIGFHVLGAYIHILLVIAVIVLIFALIGGRRTVI